MIHFTDIIFFWFFIEFQQKSNPDIVVERDDRFRRCVMGVEVFELSRKVSNAGTSFSWTIVLILWMVFVEVVGEDKSLVSDGIHLHGSEILKY